MFLKINLRAPLHLACRARITSYFFWSGIFIALSTFISSEFSARQPATIGLDNGLSVMRLTLPFVSAVLLQELVSREFDRKLYLTSITYPQPRHQFLLGRIIATTLLLFGMLIGLAALLAGLTTWINFNYAQSTPPNLGLPYVVTIAFIALDLLVVLAIGTLIAVTTTTPNFVLIGTLGFMLVARSYSAIVALLTRDTTLVGNADTYQSSLSLLGYLLPDLGALDVRMISLYGDWQFLPDDWPLRVVSTLAYAAALFALSVWALNRKKFD